MSRHLTGPPGAALCWGTRLAQIAGSERIDSGVLSAAHLGRRGCALVHIADSGALMNRRMGVRADWSCERPYSTSPTALPSRVAKPGIAGRHMQGSSRSGRMALGDTGLISGR